MTVGALRLFLVLPCVGMYCEIVVFPGHSHLLFVKIFQEIVGQASLQCIYLNEKNKVSSILCEVFFFAYFYFYLFKRYQSIVITLNNQEQLMSQISASACNLLVCTYPWNLFNVRIKS